ncbi:MAG: hypothetical protein R3C59_29810 [Planctomycetaceae bacterium]
MLCERHRHPFLTAAVLIICVWFSGCSGSSAPDPAVDNSTNSATTSGETEAEKCRNKLSGAMRRLEPERMDLHADPERAITGLNAWIASCARDEVEALKLDDAALALLNSNPRALAGRYTGVDATYIRDALLLRDLTAALTTRQPNTSESAEDRETARVVRIFDWVIRNVSLIPDDTQRPALSLFDVLLIGRGTADDRAWILAEMLRQQQIDAVLVRTTAPPADDGGVLDTAMSLIAVIQNDVGLLFDVVTGLPVVVGDDRDLLKPAPADVSVLKDHERWNDSTVEVIAQVAAFAPRMLVLQDRLAAEDAAILFEELTGGVSEIRPLRDRITSAGQLWTKDDISVWTYPEDRVIASHSRSEAQIQEYDQLMRPFDAPFERKVYEPESVEELTTVPEELSPEQRRLLAEERLMANFERITVSSEERFGKPSRRLLKARTQQVQGSIDSEVIQQMQQIRIASMEERIRVAVPALLQEQQGLPAMIVLDLPKLIREVNQSSTGDSMYWTALCQLDREEFGAAITTFSNYRRQYPDGKWKYPSLVHQSLALLKQDRTDDAIAALKEADQDDNPEQRRVRMMLQVLSK